MAKWEHEVDLYEAFEYYRDTENFEGFKELAMEVLENTARRIIPEEFVDALSSCEDSDEWDYEFNQLYDYCDENRIWIKTF